MCHLSDDKELYKNIRVHMFFSHKKKCVTSKYKMRMQIRNTKVENLAFNILSAYEYFK